MPPGVTTNIAFGKCHWTTTVVPGLRVETVKSRLAKFGPEVQKEGSTLLVSRYARVAAWGLIALLIAVFPAQLHMAMNNSLSPDTAPIALWLRLPLQAVLIAWAYWYTRRER